MDAESARILIPRISRIQRRTWWRLSIVAIALWAWLLGNRAAAQRDSFRFVILGDRTGDTEPGIYARVWEQAGADQPAFVVSVGDSIEGLNDATADLQWRQLEEILAPYRRFPLFLAPGNHDIWSAQSRALFQKYAAHAPHYSFDYMNSHFTVLDNSRTEQLSSEELLFLADDLEAHKSQPVKLVVSHRPSWLLNLMFQNSRFPLHELARKYGVKYVIAGHTHQMLEADLDGITYLSMVSAGGHLRGTGQYRDGWFFGYARVDVRGEDVDFRIQELKAPQGQGRLTVPKDWGKGGSRGKVATPQPQEGAPP